MRGHVSDHSVKPEVCSHCVLESQVFCLHVHQVTHLPGQSHNLQIVGLERNTMQAFIPTCQCTKVSLFNPAFEKQFYDSSVSP